MEQKLYQELEAEEEQPDLLGEEDLGEEKEARNHTKNPKARPKPLWNLTSSLGG
jgi:hypothetical protein